MDSIFGTQFNVADEAWVRWLEIEAGTLADGYKLYREYYEGVHGVPLSTRQAAFLEVKGIDFRFNYMALPVNLLRDRIRITGFDVDGKENASYVGEDGLLHEWWNGNRMQKKARVIRKSMLVDGDTFVMVGWDNDTNAPVITHEKAYDGYEGMQVFYTSKDATWPSLAIRRWREIDPAHITDVTMRMNVYTADAIYKYTTNEGTSSYSGAWVAYYENEGDPWPIPWTAGVVPVVHFSYEDDGDNWGRSILDDIIPVQKALNKQVIDIIDGSDFAAHRIITLTGGRADNEEIRPGQILWHDSPDAGWGHIPPAVLADLRDTKNDYVATIAQFTQIPLNYFQTTGQVASDDTQEADDANIAQKAEAVAIDDADGFEQVMWLASLVGSVYGRGVKEIPASLITARYGSFSRMDKTIALRRKLEVAGMIVQMGGAYEAAIEFLDLNDEEKETLLRSDYGGRGEDVEI